MTDLESREEGTNLSPEELQRQTLTAYRLLPQYFPFSNFIANAASREEALIASFEYAKRRVRGTEASRIVADKLKRLVAQSPTSDSYKREMGKLIDSVAIHGSINPTFKKGSSESYVLVKSLQLNTSVGIYTPSRARIGEDVLYTERQRQLAISLQFVIELGGNPEDPRGYDGFHNPTEQRASLQRWEKEYIALYGSPPPR